MVRVECSVRWLKSWLRVKCVEHIFANKVLPCILTVFFVDFLPWTLFFCFFFLSMSTGALPPL